MAVTYLDNNATTRPTPAVLAAVAEAGETLWANPSSVHRAGQQVRQRLELARASTAALLGARPREVVFTSGGTESVDLALRGTLAQLRRAPATRELPATLITSRVEHAAVRELAEALAEEASGERRVKTRWLELGPGGAVGVASLQRALAEVGREGGTAVLSLQWANNETGAVQPMAEVAAAVAAAREAGGTVVWHCDGTQAVGKLPVDVRSAEVAGLDLLSFAGHKFHGPKGVGGLWLRRGVRLRPQQHGGPQEMERRGGTENVPGILGLGVAAQEAAALVGDADRVAELAALRDRLEQRVAAGLRDAGLGEALGPSVNGGGVPRLWNTTNLGFRGLEAEAVLLGLSERGVCVSAGAACSSGSLEPSPVLRAMGVEEAVAHGSLRFSLSRFSTEPEVDHAAATVVAVAGRLAAVMPV